LALDPKNAMLGAMKKTAKNQHRKTDKKKKYPKNRNKKVIVRPKNNKSQKNASFEGKITITPTGIGFVNVQQLKQDLRIENRFLNTALHNDIVKISSQRAQRDTTETKVVKIIKRAKMEYVGVIEKEDANYFYIKPQDPRMYVDIIVPKPYAQSKQVGYDQKVFIRITKWENAQELPQGKILQIIGKIGAHETEMNAIILDKGILSKFPRDVEKEAEYLKKTEKTILNNANTSRADYRGISTFTIDPDDAKDFDDALSYQTLPNKDIEIGVHIADVSHYIKNGTALDFIARERGTSTYLVDRTIPMLPEILSNDLCSLNPKEDKLAFSVLFTFNKEAVIIGKPFELKKYDIKTTIINSDKRFTYNEAQKILNTKKGIFNKELTALNILAKKLAKHNKEEGAISFAQEEVKFTLDKTGKPIDIQIKKTGETNELIENFMLLANQMVVEYVHKKVPKKERLFLYRVHDKPDKERILELIQLLHGLGYTIRDGINDNLAYKLNKVLDTARETKESNIIQIATIRAMAKAIYSIQNIGHFGLAFENYTHFTSPIRRYVDLVVHRLIKTYQQGKRIAKKDWVQYNALVNNLSEKEKNAMEAERDSVKYKQVEYMRERIGKVFNGTIISVTNWGIYVKETKTKAEGLIHIKDIGDEYFVFEKEKMRILGKRSKKIYRLGDTVKIKVIRADVNERIIQYQLV